MSGFLKALCTIIGLGVAIIFLDWLSGTRTSYASFAFSVAFYALWRTYSSPAAVVQPPHPSHDGQAQSASPNGDDAREIQR